MTSKGHALAREELVRALTAYTGIATEDGLANGTTIVDAALKGKNDFVTEKTILIMTGDAAYEDRGASDFDNTSGTITVISAFKDSTGAAAQIKKGTIYRILNISTVEIDVETINTKIGTKTDAAGATTLFARLRQIVDTYLANGTIGLSALKALIDAIEGKLDGASGLAAIKAVVDAILVDTSTTLETKLDNIKTVVDVILVDTATTLEGKLDTIATVVAAILVDTGTTLEAKLDKLAGETPVSDSVTANWNTGEANIVSIGADNTKYKLHSLLLNISALDNDAAGGSAITIRMYMEVNGTERKVYEQTFTQGTDPDGLWIVNGTLGIHEVLRVTAQSDKAPDNGKAIDYDYMLEAM